MHIFKDTNLRLDPCMTCLNAAAGSTEALLYAIVDHNVTTARDVLSEAVYETRRFLLAGVFADLVCQPAGIKQFVKIVERADLDRI